MNDVQNKIARNKRFDGLFAIIGLLSTMVGMIVLAALILDLATAGASRLAPHFSLLFRRAFPHRPASCPPGWEPVLSC